MIWVRSERVSRREVGWVAEFCPFCREIAPHRLARLNRTDTLQGVSIHVGELLGFQTRCADCGHAALCEEESFDRVHAGTRLKLSLAELIRDTNPALQTHMAERLRLEQALRENRLPRAARAELLAEPFLLSEKAVEERAQKVHFDAWSILAAAGFVLTFCIGLLSLQTTTQKAAWYAYPLLGASFISAGIAIHLVRTDARRYSRKNATARIARALAPLRPSSAELAETVARQRERGNRAAIFVDLAALQLKIDEIGLQRSVTAPHRAPDRAPAQRNTATLPPR